jgi:outer membrane protein assembly factor BamB
MPSTTRRRVLGAAAVAAASFAAYRLHEGATDATFASWTPAPGTWPLTRYDPANTAHNPTASPPRESPSVREVASVPTDARRPRFRPLVGPDHVALAGSGLTVVGREDGRPVRESAVATPLAGFGPDGRLHAVHRVPDDSGSSSLVGYAGDDRREAYRIPIDDGPSGMTVGSSEVYVGDESGTLRGVDPETGRRWRADGAKPALDGDSLYVADAPLDGTVAYAGRTGVDRRLSVGPKRVWSSGADHVHGFAHEPAVADGRVVQGSYAEDGGAVVAFDAHSGEPLWEPLALGANVATPAVVGDRGYAAVGTDDLTAGLVAALDLSTGETVWRDEVEWHAVQSVVGGETLVVAGEVRDGGTRTAGVVRAYEPTTGGVLWTHTLDTRGLGRLAVVGDRVLVTADASLYELA